MNLEVVLVESDPKLGKRGDVIKVSAGYAQNFLIPHRKALPATPANLQAFRQEKERQAKDEAQRLEEARQVAQKLGALSVTLEMRVGEGEKLYGAVTSQDIVTALAAQGVRIERKDVHLEEPIKKLGTYQVPLRLHRDVSAKLKLWVVQKKS